MFSILNDDNNYTSDKRSLIRKKVNTAGRYSPPCNRFTLKKQTSYLLFYLMFNETFTRSIAARIMVDMHACSKQIYLSDKKDDLKYSPS